MNQFIKRRLNDLIDSKGLTQDELGKLLNKNQSAISTFLKNCENNKTVNLLTSLSKTLNVSVDYLLGLSNNSSNTFVSSLEDEELQKKVEKFILQNVNKNKRPLSGEKVENILIQLKNAGVSLNEIKIFLKSELDIDVSVQAIGNKITSLKNKEQK